MRKENNRLNRSNRRSDGNKFNSGFRNNYGGLREMHKAICSDCGNECEVPFKPTEGKTVYCRTCFSKHKPRDSK